MQPLLIAKLLVLLGIANGTPVVVQKLLGQRLAQPIDGGGQFIDGHPIFGSSKTIRGVVASIALTTAAAPVLGLDASMGAVVAGAAMLGDLFSSFIKRRLKLAPSSRATGLDQIPESLFPLLACSFPLSLAAAEIVIGVAAFSVGEIVLSRVFYRIGLRDRPY